MTALIEVVAGIYVGSCLIAVGLDLWMHRAFRVKDERRRT